MKHLLFPFLAVCLLCGSTSAVPRPNIILFLVDDMGWMDSTPYGSQYYDTPSMQRLAKQSIRFTQAYSQPLCSPTRASLLTGQYSARHGITSASGHQPPQPDGHDFYSKNAPANRPLLYPESKNYLEPAQYTLAEALRDAGYRTGHFGKWHLGLTEAHWPEKQGFDVAFHSQPSAGPPGEYFSPYGVVLPGTPREPRKGKTYTGTITDGPPGEYITDRLTNEAIKFIRTSKDKPFFLNLWHYGVHGPWGHKQAITAEMAKRKDPTGRQGNPIMASMLKSVDESLGRILDTLDELNLAGNTIIIFTSDNGGNTHSMTEEDAKTQKRKADDPRLLDWRKWAGTQPPTNNAPLRDGKGRLYEGGTRVPLMVRWPGKIAAGATSDTVVGCIDVYPTVLDLIGVAPNPQQKIDGASYAPVLLGTGELRREAYFIWFPHLVPGVSVHSGDWKLIRRFEQRPDQYEGTRELFNLKDDLGETTNLASKLPDKVRELDALIDAFVKDTGALYPKPNPAYPPKPEGAANPPAAGAADPMAGLVPKFCKATLVEGAIRIQADGRAPFLGTAQVKSAGPLTLKLRLRTSAGGKGKVQWVTREQTEFPKDGQTIEFAVAPGDWQDIKIDLPIQGESRIIRLYVPADQAAVEIQTIEFTSQKSKLKSWDLSKAKP